MFFSCCRKSLPARGVFVLCSLPYLGNIQIYVAVTWYYVLYMTFPFHLDL